VEHPEGLLTAVTLLERARARRKEAGELLVRSEGNTEEAGRLLHDAHALMMQAEDHVARTLGRRDATTVDAGPDA
jgi:hypothetical protein